MNYEEQLKLLGEALKRVFPACNWTFHESAGVWKVVDCDVYAMRGFIVENDGKYWVDILGVENVTFLDFDDWFGFTIG